jgi:hypothetical protein
VASTLVQLLFGTSFRCFPRTNLEDRVSFPHLYRNVVLYRAWWRCNCSRQIDPNTLPWVWLRLTIMKLASRKNMMSISGMISIRALLCGTGEVTLIR